MHAARHPRGFTLLELLCGLAVVSILLTLSFPVLGKFKVRAQSRKCVSNLAGLGVGVKAYMADHNNCWPQIRAVSSTADAPEGTRASDDFAEQWIKVLGEYGISETTWHCPAIEGKIVANGTKEALKRKRLDYAPTQFSGEPGIAVKWAEHPWFIERTPIHGLGPNMLLSNGKVVSLEDLLKNLR